MNNKIYDLIDYSEGGILSKEILKNNKINVALFCMAKGTELSEHTTTKAGFVFVLEGHGAFNFKEKGIKMEKGVFIELPQNAVHSLKAKENTSFLLVLV